MKNLSAIGFFKFFLATLLLNCFNIICWSQDSSTSKTVSTTTTEHREWYSVPWVWVVGGVIVIVLLVAIINGSRRSSRTTVTDTGAGTRTITTDND